VGESEREREREKEREEKEREKGKETEERERVTEKEQKREREKGILKDKKKEKENIWRERQSERVTIFVTMSEPLPLPFLAGRRIAAERLISNGVPGHRFMFEYLLSVVFLFYKLKSSNDANNYALTKQNRFSKSNAGMPIMQRTVAIGCVTQAFSCIPPHPL